MAVKIALAGNPNCGKTTLFNALTGANQYVGNWPGVTVEKKEGKLIGHKDVNLVDLPGIYSLSPYTLEEVVARNYLIGEQPDAIINIVDGTNIERNLYLTTQIIELGIPVLMAINMMDIVRKNGDKINIKALGEKLGCEVVEISALKKTGIKETAEKAIEIAKSGKSVQRVHHFADDVESTIAGIEEKLGLAVAENQKDAARYSLYHALQEIDYRGVERVVRINGLDTPHWKEDIRVCVAGGADTIRIAKTETAQDVHTVEEHVLAAEREFGRPEGSTLLMAALESCKGVLNALEVCKSSDRLIGIALSGGDYTKDLQTVITGTGVELQGARQQMIIAARAAGVQCWDTVFTNLDAMDVFEEEVKMIKMMGFDGKSLVNPRQIDVVHKIFTPTQKEIIFAEKVVKEIDEKKALGIGVFTVDGKMIDIAFYDGAKRTIALAKASGVYEGDL